MPHPVRSAAMDESAAEPVMLLEPHTIRATPWSNFEPSGFRAGNNF